MLGLGPIFIKFILVCKIRIHSPKGRKTPLVHHRLHRMTPASSVTVFSENGHISSDVVSPSGLGPSHRTHSIRSFHQHHPDGVYINNINEYIISLIIQIKNKIITYQYCIYFRLYEGMKNHPRLKYLRRQDMLIVCLYAILPAKTIDDWIKNKLILLLIIEYQIDRKYLFLCIFKTRKSKVNIQLRN